MIGHVEAQASSGQLGEGESGCLNHLQNLQDLSRTFVHIHSPVQVDSRPVIRNNIKFPENMSKYKLK
jgi:hypothetical protein